MINQLVIDGLAQYLLDNQRWFLPPQEYMDEEALKQVLTSFFKQEKDAS